MVQSIIKLKADAISIYSRWPEEESIVLIFIKDEIRRGTLDDGIYTRVNSTNEMQVRSRFASFRSSHRQRWRDGWFWAVSIASWMRTLRIVSKYVDLFCFSINVSSA